MGSIIEPIPVPAPPPASMLGIVGGLVIDESKLCVVGAQLEIIDGVRAGASFVVTAPTPWDYWECGEFWFEKLPLGQSVTLRAKAVGYKPIEIPASPATPFASATIIVLTKLQ